MKNIAFIGPQGSGKSSLVNALLGKNEEVYPTIGMMMYDYHAEPDGEDSKFWDISGDSRFYNMLATYLNKKDHIYFCVTGDELNNPDEDYQELINTINKLDPKPPVSILLMQADKFDYQQEVIPGLDRLRGELEPIDCIPVSSQDQDAIQHVVESLAAVEKRVDFAYAPKPLWNEQEIKDRKLLKDDRYTKIWDDEASPIDNVIAIFRDYCKTSYSALVLAGHPKRRHHKEVRDILNNDRHVDQWALLDAMNNIGVSDHGSMHKRIRFCELKLVANGFLRPDAEAKLDNGMDNGAAL